MKKSGKKPGLATTKSPLELGRRDFLTLLGGGVIIYFGTSNPSELLAMPLAQRREVPEDYNAFLRIDEDGTVHCYTGKIEMGQGPITSLPQQIADELDVSLDSVKMVMGDTLLCPYDAGTWGSLTTREFSHYLRAAGAEARAVLLELGSEYLDIPVKDLKVKNGIIFGASNPKKQVSYGELAKGQRIERFMKEKPDVKDHTQFRYVGQSRLHSDAGLKVTGKAKYTGDMKLPGMVYAKILRPPSHLSKLISVDTSEAEAMEGIQVVRDGELVAVVHEQIERAEQALRKVKAEFSPDDKEIDDKNIFQYLLNAPSDSRVVASNGNLEEGVKLSDEIFESEFHDGYVAHSPMEPHSALALWEGEKVTVWASSQSPFGAQDEIARSHGLELEQVRVISPFVGGGFGGKSFHPQVSEVVRVARLVQKPVMLIYTREEEFFMDDFRPAAVVKIRSGITTGGKIALWDFRQYFAGNRGSNTIYNVPHASTTGYDEKRGEPVHPFPTGPWRAPGNNTNTFSRESQIDIMAARAGVDPVQFRLNNLSDEKMISVIETLVDKFGYTQAAGPSGRGIGMACGIDAGTWVAVMIEVRVDLNTGNIQPIRAVCSQDMGLCVNPEGATIQVEGCITMGMGYALSENVEFKGGHVITSNFDNYQLPLFSWVPETIETVILDRKELPPQGGGEPAIICMGGALANAIFDACGARLYQMPMTPELVLEAIKKKKA
jgi:nicotinate dehydrogenase subunit B